MAYSYMTLVSDGTLKSAPITFEYMKVEDLVVHQNIRKLEAGIDYTISNNIITFKEVIPALDRIAVDRMSQRDALRVKFLEGATFSRENMDDVLTQILYLTQEAMEGSVDRISPTGVLDLAGNRIINLGDPEELQDAVPLHLLVDAEKSVYASEAKTKQYRDEALASKNAAFTYADNAYASEIKAKASEIAAYLSEQNAKAHESAAAVSKDAAKVSETNAKTSETNAKASELAAAATEDRLEGAVEIVEGYGARLSAVETGKLDKTGGVLTGNVMLGDCTLERKAISFSSQVGSVACGTLYRKYGTTSDADVLVGYGSHWKGTTNEVLRAFVVGSGDSWWTGNLLALSTEGSLSTKQEGRVFGTNNIPSASTIGAYTKDEIEARDVTVGEAGLPNTWCYTKFANGLFIGTFYSPLFSLTVNSGKYGDITNGIAYPVPLVAPPALSISFSSSSNLVVSLVQKNVTKDNTGALYVLCDVPSATLVNCSVRIMVTGYWK